ncbi:MAG: ferrous iron transport protein A [Peptococcaceae bacterium]|jgi:ferrous iron transport protein A|nr:ferrous iron transport protein A [Peptococcaceae bacterium]
MDTSRIKPLSRLIPGQKAAVIKIENEGQSQKRVLDLGLIEGVRVESVLTGPFGDPSAYDIHGALIALRKEESSKIIVEILE